VKRLAPIRISRSVPFNYAFYLAVCQSIAILDKHITVCSRLGAFAAETGYKAFGRIDSWRRISVFILEYFALLRGKMDVGICLIGNLSNLLVLKRQPIVVYEGYDLSVR
jgi:hypothetical protein